MLQKEFTQKERATLSSLSSLFGSIAFGAFVILLGWVSDQVGPAKTLIGAHIFILSILYFYKKIFSEKSS